MEDVTRMRRDTGASARRARARPGSPGDPSMSPRDWRFSSNTCASGDHNSLVPSPNL